MPSHFGHKPNVIICERLIGFNFVDAGKLKRPSSTKFYMLYPNSLISSNQWMYDFQIINNNHRNEFQQQILCLLDGRIIAIFLRAPSHQEHDWTILNLGYICCLKCLRCLPIDRRPRISVQCASSLRIGVKQRASGNWERIREKQTQQT